MLHCGTLITFISRGMNRTGHCGQRDGRLARDIYGGVLVLEYFRRFIREIRENRQWVISLASTSGHRDDIVSKIKYTKVLTTG